MHFRIAFGIGFVHIKTLYELSARRPVAGPGSSLGEAVLA